MLIDCPSDRLAIRIDSGDERVVGADQPITGVQTVTVKNEDRIH